MRPILAADLFAVLLAAALREPRCSRDGARWAAEDTSWARAAAELDEVGDGAEGRGAPEAQRLAAVHAGEAEARGGQGDAGTAAAGAGETDDSEVDNDAGADCGGIRLSVTASVWTTGAMDSGCASAAIGVDDASDGSVSTDVDVAAAVASRAVSVSPVAIALGHCRSSGAEATQGESAGEGQEGAPSAATGTGTGTDRRGGEEERIERSGDQDEER